jgi:glycosyltransferase involved in cell wall biosynthesis
MTSRGPDASPTARATAAVAGVAARRAARFTVVLPVRNGGSYLPECVESVLAQSCGDLSLEILENGSVDGTAEWLATIRDPRVRVWPAPHPLSIEQNWQRAGALEKGEFLLFVGHDDRLDRGFLARVDGLMRRFPDAALFTTHFRLIDPRGAVLRSSRPAPARQTMAEYLAARLTYARDMSGMGVVMRSAAYDAAGGIPPFEGLAHADDALWLALLDGSWLATAPEEAYSYRLSPASMFHTLPWRPAIAAVSRFASYVESLGRTRPDVREVWRRHGGTFLERRHQAILLRAILDDWSAPNGCTTRERDEILASLDRLSPEAGRRLRGHWWLRLDAWAAAWRVGPPLRAGARAYWRFRRPWR